MLCMACFFDTQSIVELFLGLRLATHFPSARLPYGVPSRAGADGGSGSSSAEDDSGDEEPPRASAAAKQVRANLCCWAARHGLASYEAVFLTTQGMSACDVACP